VGHFQILAPHSVVDGQSIADWSIEWWQWAASRPVQGNPFDDQTGAFAHQDNDGPVFFLAGTVASSDNPTQATATRAFEVEAGTPLLLPIINTEISVPGWTEEAITSLLHQFVAGFHDIFLEIDGKPIPDLYSHYEQSDFFSFGILEDTDQLGYALGFFTDLEGRQPELGVELAPAQAGGYWVVIEGLKPGVHTLHFGGSTDIPAIAGGGTFSTEITDTITVTGQQAHPAHPHGSMQHDYAFA
jgi:hypothetical protein